MNNTSIMAWDSINHTGARTKAIDKIYNYIESLQCKGITSGNLKKVPGFEKLSLTPRLIELEESGRLVRLKRMDRNPSGKLANVYIASKYVALLSPYDQVLPFAKRKPAIDAQIKSILMKLNFFIEQGRPIELNSDLHQSIQKFIK